MALLLPDPCDPSCPDEFKSRGKDLLLVMRGRPSKWDPKIKAGEGLRQASLKFVSDFANWDNAAKAAYLETGLGPARAAPPGGDTAGGGPLRQRSQPVRLLHPQGDAGGHPPSRAWPGRLADLIRATISYIQTTEDLSVGAQRCSAKGPERADGQRPGQLGTGPGV